MNLPQIIEILGCKTVAGKKNVALTIEEVCAADLMSDVLAFTTPGALLVTGLANVQSVITAHVAEIRAIVYVRGKRPDADAIKLADQKGIPLLTCPLSMFVACGKLYAQGLKSGSNLDAR